MNEGKTRIFADSNVVLYLLSGDAARADRSESLLRQTPTISVQVLNEVTNVCIRKLGMTREEVAQFLGVVRTDEFNREAVWLTKARSQ